MLLLKYRLESTLFFLFALIYIGQTVLVKPNAIALQKYGLSVMEARLLGLSIALPYIVIWVIALIGYIKMKSYADLIKKAEDGKAMQYIAWGVFFLALWLPLTTIINSEANRLSEVNPSLVQTTVILNNYLNLLILLPGFLLTYMGSKKLTDIAKTSIRTPNQTLVLLYIAFAVLYTFSVLHDPVRNTPSDQVLKATYYLSDWLIVTTLVIPRLLMWYLGLHAVQNILLYKTKVKGSLYKIALDKFAYGLCGVIVTVVTLRCFQSFSPFLASLNLGMVMVVLYVLLIGLGFGFMWMYKGASKLLYIEDLS